VLNEKSQISISSRAEEPYSRREEGKLVSFKKKGRRTEERGGISRGKKEIGNFPCAHSTKEESKTKADGSECGPEQQATKGGSHKKRSAQRGGKRMTMSQRGKHGDRIRKEKNEEIKTTDKKTILCRPLLKTKKQPSRGGEKRGQPHEKKNNNNHQEKITNHEECPKISNLATKRASSSNHKKNRKQTETLEKKKKRRN